LKTILVVDDQKLWRDRLKELITEAGYRALDVACCDTAIEAVAQCQPDLILLDYQMPGVNGVETARRIRAMEGCEVMPIIMISGEELPGGCHGTQIPHVNGFLDKKDLRNKLLTCMEHYLTVKSL
jgi:two-component system cell cycle response regulator DivK